MAKIIAEARTITSVEHTLFFEYRDCHGAGFGFECSPDGDVLTPVNEAARENLAHALAHPEEFFPPQVQDMTRQVRFGRTLRCDCGGIVNCDSSWENPCSRCEREYNMSGQLLAPRSQWGIEYASQPEEDYNYYPAYTGEDF